MLKVLLQSDKLKRLYSKTTLSKSCANSSSTRKIDNHAEFGISLSGHIKKEFVACLSQKRTPINLEPQMKTVRIQNIKENYFKITSQILKGRDAGLAKIIKFTVIPVIPKVIYKLNEPTYVYPPNKGNLIHYIIPKSKETQTREQISGKIGKCSTQEKDMKLSLQSKRTLSNKHPLELEKSLVDRKYSKSKPLTKINIMEENSTFMRNGLDIAHSDKEITNKSNVFKFFQKYDSNIKNIFKKKKKKESNETSLDKIPAYNNTVNACRRLPMATEMELKQSEKQNFGKPLQHKDFYCKHFFEGPIGKIENNKKSFSESCHQEWNNSVQNIFSSQIRTSEEKAYRKYKNSQNKLRVPGLESNLTEFSNTGMLSSSLYKNDLIKLGNKMKCNNCFVHKTNGSFNKMESDHSGNNLEVEKYIKFFKNSKIKSRKSDEISKAPEVCYNILLKNEFFIEPLVNTKGHINYVTKATMDKNENHKEASPFEKVDCKTNVEQNFFKPENDLKVNEKQCSKMRKPEIVRISINKNEFPSSSNIENVTDAITSIDKSTIIIQKDFYITKKIISKINEDKVKEKFQTPKVQCQNFLNDEEICKDQNHEKSQNHRLNTAKPFDSYLLDISDQEAFINKIRNHQKIILFQDKNLKENDNFKNSVDSNVNFQNCIKGKPEVIKIPHSRDSVSTEFPNAENLNTITSKNKAGIIVEKDLYVTENMFKKIKEKKEDEGKTHNTRGKMCQSLPISNSKICGIEDRISQLKNAKKENVLIPKTHNFESNLIHTTTKLEEKMLMDMSTIVNNIKKKHNVESGVINIIIKKKNLTYCIDKINIILNLPSETNCINTINNLNLEKCTLNSSLSVPKRLMTDFRFSLFPSENKDKVTQTKVITKNQGGTTSIDITEREFFSDKRIPIHFSMESNYQIQGKTSLIQKFYSNKLKFKNLGAKKDNFNQILVKKVEAVKKLENTNILNILPENKKRNPEKFSHESKKNFPNESLSLKTSNPPRKYIPFNSNLKEIRILSPREFEEIIKETNNMALKDSSAGKSSPRNSRKAKKKCNKEIATLKSLKKNKKLGKSLQVISSQKPKTHSKKLKKFNKGKAKQKYKKTVKIETINSKGHTTSPLHLTKRDEAILRSIIKKKKKNSKRVKKIELKSKKNVDIKTIEKSNSIILKDIKKKIENTYKTNSTQYLKESKNNKSIFKLESPKMQDYKFSKNNKKKTTVPQVTDDNDFSISVSKKLNEKNVPEIKDTKCAISLDKISKERNPPFNFKKSFKCPIPLEEVSQFPLFNCNKHTEFSYKSNQVISVNPANTPNLNEILALYPSVSRVLNTTMSKESRKSLRKWRSQMIECLGEKGFNDFYKGQLQSGSEFYGSIKNVLSGVKINKILSPSTELSLKSVNWVLKFINDVQVLESHIIHPQLSYRGVLDCVAKYRNNLVVIEWKRSDKPKSSAKLLHDAPIQLCAYIGGLNHDPNYDFQVYGGVLVMAYTNGAPADIFQLSTKQCNEYWQKWLTRYHHYLSVQSKVGENVKGLY